MPTWFFRFLTKVLLFFPLLLFNGIDLVSYVKAEEQSLNHLNKVAVLMKSTFGDRWQATTKDTGSFDSICNWGALNFGPLIWDGDTRQFKARIFETKQAGKVGYLCIPNFTFDPVAATQFSERIAHIEGETKKLIIDLRENEGGSVFQMYSYSSALSTIPLIPLVHRLNLRDEDDVKIAEDIVWRNQIGDNSFSQEEIAYSEFVLNEVKAGRDVWSRPTYLAGISQIEPTSKPFSGSIIILVDSLTFSAAELMAAMFQDNNRAVIFGTKTAGDGSGVKFKTLSSGLTMSLPWTVAYRKDGSPLKASGFFPAPDNIQGTINIQEADSGWIVPDVIYEVTVDDIRNRYKSYRNAVLGVYD